MCIRDRFHTLRDGEIYIENTLVSAANFVLPPEQRQIGMVFQDHALFPHLTVLDNVSAGLRKLPRKNRRWRANEILEHVGLTGFEKRYPHELSGGQSQRVALARALAPKPNLLLMDEPFSNLDLTLRERLGEEVRDIIKESSTTCVLVTHDQHDAFALGDHVGVLSDGELVQWDTPYNLYHEPNSRFVAGFIGDGVLLAGRLRSADTVSLELGDVQGDRCYDFGGELDADVLIRPDDIVQDPDSEYRGRVVRKAFKGAGILYTLELPSRNRILALFPSHLNFEIREEVGIRLAADHLVLFPRNDVS